MNVSGLTNWAFYILQKHHEINKYNHNIQYSHRFTVLDVRNFSYLFFSVGEFGL